jgi:hypothetical protein
MTASARLELLARHFDSAMQLTLERARRYPSAYAYRDYLSSLHAIGQSKLAWQGFSQLATQFDEPQVWLSALVGHQIEGHSDEYVRQWIERPEISRAQLGAQKFAPAFAILWSTTDRMPPADLSDLVAHLLGPPTASIGDDRKSALKKTSGESDLRGLQK